MRPVAALLTIGEFSKSTFLSVKALRHYHDVGVLEPVEIDAGSGYRRYAPEQVPIAQAIRRFRDLDMPLDEIRGVIAAPDPVARNRAIVDHLERMRRQLAETEATVAARQTLLAAETDGVAAEVERRVIAPERVLAIRDRLPIDDALARLPELFGRLGDAASAAGAAVVGPAGGLYADGFYADDAGDVTVFVPIGGPPAGELAAGVEDLTLPGGTYAVVVHEGGFDDLDRAYARLGTWVAAEGIGDSGPIREAYPSEARTEVAWPIRG